MKSQRNEFLDILFEKAKLNKDIILITVDMGAESLDKWRLELPDQFISVGICEQNAINVAAGLSHSGKKVYVYFMAIWASRCFEQIRYSCALANNPITILANGVGLAYAPAGPAHEPTEDISYMRSLNNIEIYNLSNLKQIRQLVDLTLDDPKLRYIRLERSLDPIIEKESIEDLIKEPVPPLINSGIRCVRPGLRNNRAARNASDKICILTTGFMLGRALKVWQQLIELTYQISVYDIWKLKPINKELLYHEMVNYDYIITLEEHQLDGGLGSVVCEALSDLRLKNKILRIALPEQYIFENGNRNQLLDRYGLSVENIIEKINTFLSLPEIEINRYDNTDEDGD
jgi:transketolase